MVLYIPHPNDVSVRHVGDWINEMQRMRIHYKALSNVPNLVDEIMLLLARNSPPIGRSFKLFFTFWGRMKSMPC
jgi:hypothetical protein